MPRLRESPGEAVVSEWRHALRALFWVLLVSAPLGAQDECSGEWQIRGLEDVPGAESGARTTLDVDIANNARIASVVDGELWFTIIGAGSEATFRLDGGDRISSAALETNERGVSAIVYTQRSGEDPEAAREVFLVQTFGGSFTSPRNISNSPADDRDAQLALDRRGEAHVTWARATPDASQVLYWNPTLSTLAVAVARGDVPAIFVDQDDVAHIACVQGSEILYVNNATGSFTGRELVTRSPTLRKSSVSIGTLQDRTVLVAFESASDLLVAVRDATGAYLSPRVVAEGGVLAPRMRVRSDGQVLLIYSQHGGLAYTLGQGIEPGTPRRVGGTEEVEGTAALDIDDQGHLHASFIQSGVTSYATNACAPVVELSVEPTAGRAPLTVRFADHSSGAIGRWEWDFGDGATSRIRNPVHVYNKPGEYTVGLTVWGAGGAFSRKVVENLVVVEKPLYALRIPDQQTLPGTKGLWFPVLGTSAEPIEGFQVAGTYDPDFLTLVRSDMRSTALSANQIAPEFIETRIHETSFEIGVVFDFVPPFGGLDLPPGEEQRLIHLIVDIPGSAPQGATTRIELLNDEELSPIRNMLAVSGQARVPALTGAEVRIRPVGPPFPRLFVRGDFDSNGQVNLTDAVAALGFLFQSGGPPICPDAGDVTDSGRIGITSVVALLNFLFTAGTAPAVPYPNPGLDPTADALGECLASDG